MSREVTQVWSKTGVWVVWLATACIQSADPPASPVEVALGSAETDMGVPQPPAPAEDGDLVEVPRVVPPPTPPSALDAGSCPERNAADVGVLVSPRRAGVGKSIRILIATLEGESALAVRLETESEQVVDVDSTFRRGAPASTLIRWTPDAPGKYRLVVGRQGSGLRCTMVRVGARAGRRTPPDPAEGGVWPVKRKWTGAEESLYSAWLGEMFAAARGDELAFTALHEVTSRPERNVLHDYFGWGEDDSSHEVGLRLRPDCADTPYFLRAYYSWKRRLPFAFRHCSRGRGKAPRCGDPQGVPGEVEPPRSNDPHVGELAVVQRFFQRTLSWGVHTGNGRTAHADARADLYSLRLDRRSVRPGAVYVDPYGHILVVVELVAGQGTAPGVLYAVDGQPDGSITRKRFWEGNFLWNPDPVLGGSGFKAFRPVVVDDDGTMAALDDLEIAEREDYGDASIQQADLDADSFYDRVESLITPGVRDPFAAQLEVVRAFHEAAIVRVTSVSNGEKYRAQHPGKTVEMPDGFAIFETTGAWENYSTPARDLRLLVALDVVVRFHEKVARQPDVYGVKPGRIDAVKVRLLARRDSLLRDPKFSFQYTRSNGELHTLRLSDLVERAPAFELAYNPNDCAEVRWGAAPAEMSTCKRRAPRSQLRKMEAYRVWFRERRRPPRGDPGPSVAED